MKVVIFGASGKVGQQVTTQALQRGYGVVAFVHNHNPFGDEPNLTVAKGSVYDATDVSKAISGSDAVLSCLGSWGQKSPSGNRNVLTAAMRALIPAMTEQKISRIITLTGAGAAEPNSEMSAMHKTIMKLLSPFPAGKVFADGEEHMQLLKQSGLVWTTIRSPIMNSSESRDYSLSSAAGSTWPTISRAAVAASMLDQLESAEWLHQGPSISRRQK